VVEIPVRNQLQGVLAVFEPLDRAQSKKTFEQTVIKTIIDGSHLGKIIDQK
jgi:hypothetical protein